MSLKAMFISCVVFTIGLLASLSNAAAQDLVSAKVLSSEGQVEIRRQPGNQIQAQKIAFSINEELRTGDTIITGRKGRLVLGLSDGSQAIIAPQTTVVIKDLSQSPRTLFNIIRGKTRIHIEKLGGQPNPYRVNTPTAVIAVRGTIFDVIVKDAETEVYLHEGEVAVTNLNLPNQQTILTPGLMTRIQMQRQPEPPRTFRNGENDGAFKMSRNDGRPQDNGRIAQSGQRPNQDRNIQSQNGRPNPSSDPGRIGQPQTMPRPNEAPRGGGRKP